MRAVRMGIGLAVVFSVLAHGAVEPWSAALLTMAAATLLLTWAAVRAYGQNGEIALHPILAPLGAMGLLGLAQWLLGLSVYPYLTRIELLMLAAYLLFVFLALQAFRFTSDFRPFVWFLLLFGFAVAFFGILQYFTFNGKLYWIRELRHGGFPFGPYVNRNHFAGLMELIVPLGLSLLLHRAVPKDQLPLVGLFTVVPVAALFLCASRGGILSFFFQIILLALLLRIRRVGRGALTMATLLLLLGGALVVWIGLGPALERFAQTNREELAQGRRIVIVKDGWRIFLDHFWTGTGLGTFETVYPRYESFYDGKIVNHAHNDYIEILVEAGVVGAVSGLFFLLVLFRFALARLATDREPFGVAVRMGALVACAGLLLHGLVDFNLRIPSNALLFFLLAVVATSLERPPERPAPPEPSPR